MPLNEGPRAWRIRIGAVLLAAAVLAAGVAVWARGAAAPPAPRAGAIPVQTVEVARTDLSTSRVLRGSLGYGTPRVVKGGREGVLTSLPQPGQVMKRGAVMYRVNDEPVPLFLGNPPLFRTLGDPGTVGRDVAVVQKNLKALGYATGAQPRPGTTVTRAAPPATSGQSGADREDGEEILDAQPTATRPPPGRVTVREGDAVLTTALIKAIKRWQRDTGMSDDGVLEVGDLVVLPDPVRVDSVAAVVGDSAAGDLLAVTPTTKVVTSQIAAAEAASLIRGAAVVLLLPDGAEAPGTVGAVATVASTPDGSEPGAPQQVTVTVIPGRTVKLDGGGVEIRVEGESRSDVLAVPVNALLALSEGGYALQLPDDTLLPVETGLFAMGMVEVTGDGLREGLAVVTTS